MFEIFQSIIAIAYEIRNKKFPSHLFTIKINAEPVENVEKFFFTFSRGYLYSLLKRIIQHRMF